MHFPWLVVGLVCFVWGLLKEVSVINVNNTGWNPKQQPNKVGTTSCMVLLHQLYFGDNFVRNIALLDIKIMIIQQSETAPLGFPYAVSFWNSQPLFLQLAYTKVITPRLNNPLFIPMPTGHLGNELPVNSLYTISTSCDLTRLIQVCQRLN